MRLGFIGLLLTALFLPETLPAQNITAPKARLGLAGWVCFSDPGNVSLRDFAQHAAQVDRAYFDCYHVGPDGLPAPNPEATVQLKAYARSAAQAGNCQAWMMVTNWGNGFNTAFDRKRVQKFLHDNTLRAQHVQMLVDFAKKDGMAGIQVFYQGMERADRNRFSNFIQELGGACRKNGLRLGLVVYGNYQLWGFTPAPLAFDYKVLGNSVDEMVNMPGQQRSPTDTAGYLENLDYTEQVIACMESQVSNLKVEVEVPVIGYDWDGITGRALALNNSQFQALLQKTNPRIFRETQISKELTFSYPPNHEVWYADWDSAGAAVNIAKHFKSYGIAIWYFGGEGEKFWDKYEKLFDTLLEITITSNLPGDPLVRNFPFIDIFTDKARGHYYFAADNDPNNTERMNESTIAVSGQGGRHWLDIHLNGATFSDAGMSLPYIENLRPFLKNGALQFYVRGIKGGETFSLGFFTAPRANKAEQDEMGGGTIPLASYAEVTPQWQLVTIPLMDFPQTASVSDMRTGDSTVTPFRWHIVQTLFFKIQPGPDPFVEFQVTNIRVVPSYDPKAVHKR